MKNKKAAKIAIIVIVLVAVIFGIVYFVIVQKGIFGKLNDSTVTKYTAEEIVDVSSEYGVSYIDFPDDMMDCGFTYFCVNNKLIHLNNWFDDNYVRAHSVTVYDMDEETFTKYDLDYSEITSNELYIIHLAPYMEDEYVALMFDPSGPVSDDLYQYYIAILDSEFQIERYCGVQYEHNTCRIAADDEGYIAVCDVSSTDGRYIRVYDSEFNLVLTQKNNSYENVTTVNKKIAVRYEYTDTTCEYWAVYNSETNAFDESLIYRQGYNYVVEYGTDIITYMTQDGGLYTYEIGNDYATKIFDLSQYGIDTNALYSTVSSGGDTFFCPIVDTDEETGKSVLLQWAVISKDAADDDRQQLTYAVTGSYPTKAVSDFNRENTEYFIKVVDYSDEDGLERLEKEIVSGNIPDILDCSDIDVVAYVEKGVLSEVSDVAENAGILDVFKSAMEVDGGLYDLPYSYYIGYLSGRTSLLPDTTEYTANEIREIIEENDVTYLVDNMLGYDFMLGMIRGNEDYYLTSGAGAFAEDEFVSVLSLIKDYGFSNNSLESAVDQIVNLSFEEGDYLFMYDLTVSYATVTGIMENASEYFATGVALGDVADPSLLMTVTFGMTTSCQSEDAFARFAELVYDEKFEMLPLTDAQLQYIEENMEDAPDDLLAFIENAAESGVQRNYCGYSSIIEDEIERMIDQNIAPSKIASEIQDKMSIYINEQAK